MHLPPLPDSAVLVDALHAAYGRHANRRAMHPEGLSALGRFVPAQGLSAFIDSAFFSVPSMPAVFRFSVGGGDPRLSEASRTVRGMGVQMKAVGQQYDLALISEPVFCAATPHSFLAYLRAHAPDPMSGLPNPGKIATHRAAYPGESRQCALLASHTAPASYATTPYYSTHAFWFVGKQGKLSAARILAYPDVGVKYLSLAEESHLPGRFLVREMDERLLHGPIGFTLYAILPAAQDSLDDCSQEWLGTESLMLGRLQVEALCDDDHGLCFIPTRLPSNMAASADPVLAARGDAYELSELQRTIDRHLSR
ncbi:catalase [Duganella sp. FT135W]|uniref:catalase n=1 Tax=Duganella flavida TaxID=2692175 RepID=A0A6L8K574_9BURK|nr:catalase [Duganella flavida]MYM22649.1 catalase [Duganella flavida]